MSEYPKRVTECADALIAHGLADPARREELREFLVHVHRDGQVRAIESVVKNGLKETLDQITTEAAERMATAGAKA